MTDARTRDARSRTTPEVDDREAEWLWLWRQGLTLDDLAVLSGEPYSAVQKGVRAVLRSRGRLADDDAGDALATFGLVVTWGSSAKAKPTCDDIHPRGPMPAGSRLCCWACHASGMDGHPSLLLRPADVV